jgi:tetratricopeptide (TPR) repeat protein
MPYRYYGRYGYDGQPIVLRSELPTILEVAQTLGVRYDPKSRPEDTSLAEVRRAYERHGMHARAAAILDRELAETPEPGERKRLLSAKADELLLAGKPKDAAQTVSVHESALKQEIKDRPGQAGPWIALAHVYLSRAAGENYEKAAEALSQARKIDPSCDNSGALSVLCLYKLGRAREALEAWRGAQRADENAHAGCYSAPTVFYAALAANGAGEKELATTLAREALYRYPTHSLAAQVQELTK